MEKGLTEKEMIAALATDPVGKMLLRLPVSFDWYDYKGETVFVGVNYEASKKAKRPMMDIFYCATEACNHNVIKTVQWDKNKFSPSKLTSTTR